MQVGNLPVRVLQYNVLEYFQNAHPEFRAELEAEIAFNGLSSRIVYDNSKQAIDDFALIGPDRTITIFEPFLAFLWTLSHFSVCFYYEQNSQIENIEEGTLLDRAISGFRYGLSLFQSWSDWDLALPNPQKPDDADKYIEQANGVFMIASVYVLCHEYAHHTLGHDLSDAPADKNLADEEEKAADRYAADTLLAGVNVANPSHAHTVRVGIIIGICSIIFDSDGWDGGDDHPAPNERLVELIEFLSPNDPDNECWAWLGATVVAWSIANGKGHELSLPEASRKEKAIHLIKLSKKT